MPKKKQKLGEFLRSQRKTLKRSLHECSLLADCSDSWLSQVETGYVAPLGLHVRSLPVLAKAYNLAVSEILRVVLTGLGLPHDS